MARKKQQQTPLYSVVEDALKNNTDAIWLGENSLLASAYLIGASLQNDEATTDPATRGRKLQELIKQSVESLEPYPKEILQKTFFSGRDKLKGIWDEFRLTKPTYHRLREETISILEKILIKSLQPALRLERPVKINELVGRQEKINQITDCLQRNQSVALTGTGGIGKTTLGSYLAYQLAPQTTFWFTIYPGFNDQLEALLFSLGYFLHTQGASILWSHILDQPKENKQLDLALMQALIRHDFEQLQTNKPLLCFDEIDLLQIGEIESHSQIRTLIESLRGQVPLFLIGQQCRIETEHFFELEPLSKSNFRQWLEQLQISQVDNQVDALHEYTEGNPRLLELVITLYQMGEPFQDIIARLPTEPSVEFLLNRIWQRLIQEEQQLLMTLSVFRRPVPRHMEWSFPNAQGIWTQLIQRRLVRDDGGGLSLVLAYRMVLYRLLSIEEREGLHLRAALIREKLGDFTAAAYHYIRANQTEKAILLWHQHQQSEMNRGQTEAAWHLFNSVSITQISETAKQALSLIRSELSVISGRLTEAKHTLDTTVWNRPLLEMEALKLKGDIADLQGESDIAINAYRSSLEKATAIWQHNIPILYREMSWVYMQNRDLDSALYQSQIASYEINNLQGDIQAHSGNFSEAELCYQSALKLAETLQYTEGIAKTYSSLANVYLLQGKLDDAIDTNLKSNDMYQSIRNIIAVTGGKASLALIYANKQCFTKAIESACEALDTFQTLGIPRGISVTCQTLAESHLALNQLEDAQKYANMVIETEEIEGIPDAMRVLGEVELKRGNYAQAEKHIRDSIELAQENKDPYLEAYGWRALGQVYLAMSNATLADQSFDKAIELFEEMELDNEVQKTREVAGG